MFSQFTYGYLKEALKAHLDFEEDEMETLNINQRFHIFANEAIQQICTKKPKAKYFEFEVVAKFTPLVYDDGVLRLATIEEQNWQSYNLPEPNFAESNEIAEWHNANNVYLINQVITMPDDFIHFAFKQAYRWLDYITNKIVINKDYLTYLSDNEILIHSVGFYQIPYYATWLRFTLADDQDATISMPSDLLLTVPIYVASIILQQRDTRMAQNKREEFELAVSRCRSSNFLANKTVASTF